MDPNFVTTLSQWANLSMHYSMRSVMHYTHEQGLSMPQIRALMHLYYQAACRVSDVAGLLDVTNAAASQLVQRLVGGGLLVRTEDEQDRRVKQVALTEAGRAMVDNIHRAGRRWIENLATRFPEAEQAEIVHALEQLLAVTRNMQEEKEIKL